MDKAGEEWAYKPHSWRMLADVDPSCRLGFAAARHTDDGDTHADWTPTCVCISNTGGM